MPREILKKDAIAIGSVLNGLKSKPIAGKNIGADWNKTVIAVNIPPILMNLILFNFTEINASFCKLPVICNRRNL